MNVLCKTIHEGIEKVNTINGWARVIYCKEIHHLWSNEICFKYVKDINHWSIALCIDVDDEIITKIHISKAFASKVIDTTYYEHTHAFVLMYHPLMARLLDRYNKAKEANSNLALFQHRINKSMLYAMSTREAISEEIFDINNIRANVKADFF